MSRHRDRIAEEIKKSASEVQQAAKDKSRLSVVTKERDALLAQLGVIESWSDESVARPRWLAPPRKKGSEHHATLNVLVTDTHFDEEVDPAEIDGINAYNREIAELRLRRCAERAVLLARHYLGGMKYDGVCLMLGGDIFSGNIHEELARTNRDTLFGSLLHWIGPMGALVGMMADEFKKIHVVGVPGNHGRLTRKPVAKKRAPDNLDWLLYHLLRRDFKSDDRVTWEISRGADAHVQIYDVRYLLTHGDQFRGGSGISGALAPLLLGTHRKTRRQAAAGRPYDYMVMGHWHQEMCLPARGLIVGPCLKGYDEFAYVQNYEPEKPKQLLWITTPERGITFTAPIFVSDRKAEGW